MNERSEIPENITHTEYFNRLLKDTVNNSPIPKIPILNVIFQFEIPDKGIWNIVGENSVIKEVKNKFLEIPPCTFKLNSATFLSILRRETTPQKVFFKGKVDINGNMILALKMNILINYL